MFKGDPADRFAGTFFAHVDGGMSGGSHLHRLGSKDHHRYDRKLELRKSTTKKI